MFLIHDGATSGLHKLINQHSKIKAFHDFLDDWIVSEARLAHIMIILNHFNASFLIESIAFSICHLPNNVAPSLSEKPTCSDGI